jgi:hypothetical protein
MNTRRSIVLAVMLSALLVGACTPATVAQPVAAATRQNQPPAPTAALEPTQAAAPAATQSIDHAATQQAFNYNLDQKVMAATAVASTGPDHFSGAWAGTMSFTDDAERKEDIQVMIPQDCKVGQACGYIDNLTVKCKWEMTLADLQGNVFTYKFSKTLSGECPALGGGKLTMQADGTLQREHKTPNFTASGPLTKVIAVASTGPDHFSGMWAGTMSFTDDAKRKEDIQVVIPQGCQVGGVCGYIDNLTVKCKWEMTLADLQGNVFAYKFSKTLSGECPALGGGTLTLQTNGALQREHKTPDFTASGPLTKQK